MEQPQEFVVSVSPHLRDKVTIPRIMWTVVITLLPVWIWACYLFGWAAFKVVSLSIISAVVAEAIAQKIMKKQITVYDGSAVLTGMLLAYTLPPDVPFWIPVIGAFFAIIIGKQVFGGLGNNPLNPALLGRAFLTASWPVHITSKWLPPKHGTLSGIDTVTNATPLALVKALARGEISGIDPNLIKAQLSSSHLYWNLFIGKVGGCIGETSALLILLGGLVLLYKKYIEWRLPLTYIATVGGLAWIFAGDGWFKGDILFHILAGGLFLGAFYMATDMVTSPLTNKGKVIFGFGCGLITILIRLKGGYPEGVCYSILLMNLTVPLIDKYTRPKKFGEVKR